jgi:transcriptional regulator with XRE-family HTH domain
MDKRQARRITRELSPAEHERVKRARQQIAAELPEMAARDQMRKEAREEATLSGQLRRAVHASDLPLSAIAAQVGITPLLLDEFLTGERTLRSDVIDRLANVLGCQISQVP